MSSQHRHAGVAGAGAATLPAPVRAVLAAAIAGLLAGVLWGVADAPRYTATATVLVSGDGGAPATDTELGAAVQLAGSERVASRTAILIGGDVGGADILSDVEVSADPGAGAVRIAADSESPDFAAAAANGYALALTKVGGKRFELGSEATIPDSPSENRSAPLWGLFGLLAGTALGFGGVALRDRRARAGGEAEPGSADGAAMAGPEAGGRPASFAGADALPVANVVELGAPGDLLRFEGGRVETDPEAGRGIAALAARLAIGADDGPRVLTFIDGDEAGGALAVASSLAIAAGGMGVRAIVVESDVASPALAALLDLPATPGLIDYLRGDAAPRDVLRSVRVRPGEGSSGATQLTCVLAGEAEGDGIDEERFAALIERLARVYDLVLVCGPPVADGAAAVAVAAPSEGVVLVASAAGDVALAFREAVGRLGETPVRVGVLTGSGAAQSRPQSAL